MSRGKWSVPGVPHKGWRLVSFDDLGDLLETCAMCETQEIRYVHYMEHDNYPEVLGVGSVCAGHMEEDYTAPRQREQRAKSLATRQSRWMNATWRESLKDNPFLNRNGFNVVLYPTSNLWAYRIERRDSGLSWRTTGYLTLEDAKLAAFHRYEDLRQ